MISIGRLCSFRSRQRVLRGERRRPLGEKGLTLMEMMATLTIVGLMLATAVPAFSSRTIALSSATESFLGALRMARANATGRGVHFRVTINSDSYATQRLQDPDGDGVWSPDGAPQETQLPEPAYFSAGAGMVVEFNTRGLLVPPAGVSPAPVIAVQLRNPDNGSVKIVQIWPSGQVGEL